MGERPAWRVWLMLIGALSLYVVVFDQLERRAAPADRPAPPRASERSQDPPEPIRPTVTRTGDRIEIALGWYRTTIRLGGDDGAADALLACIEQTLEHAESEGRLAGSPGSADLFDRFRREAEIAEEMNRVVRVCLGRIDRAPALPPIGE